MAVETSAPRVPLRETIAGKANGLGRNVKQTGGHGEYAICHIEVEPMPGNAGFEFVDKVVGGVVPRQFIPSVEKGVRAQMEQGVVAGYPMVGLRVTLYDGKAHSVDSSDMAFQKAGRAALRDAVDKAQSMLLEPVDEVSVLVPDDYVGAVMSDLSSRRGRVLGTEPVPVGRTLVKAEIPELEITRYTIDLRSVSHGTGSFSRSYLRHEPLPAPPGRQDRRGVQGVSWPDSVATPATSAERAPRPRGGTLAETPAATGPQARSLGRSRAARRSCGVLAMRGASPGGPGARPQSVGQASARSLRVSRRSSGRTRVWPTTGMKLVSPPQRGTTCWCRWAAMPAPATPPRFMPTLKPCAFEAVRRARIERLVWSASSAVSASSSSV